MTAVAEGMNNSPNHNFQVRFEMLALAAEAAISSYPGTDATNVEIRSSILAELGEQAMQLGITVIAHTTEPVMKTEWSVPV